MNLDVQLKKQVILCVDDERIVLDALYRQLQRKFGDQYLYEFVESGEEGLEVIAELIREGHPIKMIVCDQIMPGISGDQFLSRVHSKDPKSIKILLTGQASLESAINAINNAGIFRYIKKPWEEQDFLKIIEKGLERYDQNEILEKSSTGNFTAADIAKLVQEPIQKKLAQSRQAPFDSKSPLMSLGFTSMDLLELRDYFEETFGEKLHATFFFQYTSAEAITQYFIQKILNRHYDWLYSIELRALPLTQAQALPEKGLWVVFADAGGRLSGPLIAALKAEGQSVVTLKPGEEFVQQDPMNYDIRPREMEDVDKVFKELIQKKIHGIIYLWGLVENLPSPINLKFLEEEHRRSCEGILFLLKALHHHLGQSAPRLWIINEIREKIADPRLLAQSPLAWLTGAIVTEHPELTARRLVFDGTQDSSTNIKNCIETFKSLTLEDQIFWFNGKPLVARLSRFHLPESRSPVVLDASATYVIVGGCGGLGNWGLQLAHWHIVHGAKKLLLLDPLDISPQSEEFIRQLRENETQVDVVKFDVTDKATLQKIFKKYHLSESPIQGISHVLGLMDEDKLLNLSWERFENVMQYKIPVAWFLHEITEELSLKLDHFIFFSAIGSIMGPLWRSSQSAANGFISALVHYRRALGLPGLVIDWGPWSGVPYTDPMFEVNLPQGIKLIDVREGLDLLTELYSSPLPEVIAVNIEWAQFLENYVRARPIFYDIQGELGLRQSELLLQLQNQDSKKQNKIILEYVKQHLRRVLFKPAYLPLDEEQTLLQIGIDELRLEELRQHLQYDLGSSTVLPAHLFQENITIKSLSEGLLGPIKNIKLDRRRSVPVLERDIHAPIAVIGMACRFPGAKNYNEFWENLKNGLDSISEVPSERWDWRRVDTKVKWGGFIKDVDKFDPLFFNISPKEASYMDPQHRIFLETAWHAMEDAGYSSKMLAGKAVGVYAGVSKNDYAELMREKNIKILPFISTGTVHSILTNRFSYNLDIHGPSESMDTACSSALVALNYAIQDLRNGVCKLAFVGGVNALLSPTMYVSHSKSGMLSEDGRCKTFDESANGYVRGEGVGVLLLKPLNEALRDGDFIHAVIRGIAVNHGGKSSGLTAPNILAQAEVVQGAIKDAEIEPETISFIEAHGTGTPLGDPIEIDALKKVFANVPQEKMKKDACVLGAAKTNVGHCESAAGMVGIFKMILAMKHHAIPANLHFRKLNPKIHFENSPFRLATEYEEWNPLDYEKNPIKRRGGVSSFGMGGANAHVILEEASGSEDKFEKSDEMLLFPISAKKGRLYAYIESFNQYFEKLIQENKAVDLRALSYTLQTGRDSFEERVIFAANSIVMLRDQMLGFLKGKYSLPSLSNEALVESSKRWMNKETVDWDKHWPKRPQRLSGLPNYPFQAMRCWFEEPNKEMGIRIPSDRFFLKDHIIAGKSLLPGVMYLEIARDIAEKKHNGKILIGLRDINWISPIEAKGEFVDIKVELEGGGEAHFKITEGGELRCSGVLIDEQTQMHPERIEVQEIIRNLPNKKQKAEIYETMNRLGLQQGPSFRVLEEFYSGPRSALGKLVLNDTEELGEYVLHPALMDGVYQTVVAHHFSEHRDAMRQYLPYALESVEWFRPLEKNVLAFVEELPESKEGLLKYRMKMLTLEGDIIVAFEGFARRPLTALAAPSMRDIYYKDIWKAVSAVENRVLSPYLLLFSGNEALKTEISSLLPGVQVILVGIGLQYEKYNEGHYVINPSTFDNFQELMRDLKERNIFISELIYAWDILELLPILFLIQAIMQARCFDNLLILYTYFSPTELSDAQYAMAAGFARTLIFENPNMELRSIEVDRMDIKELVRVIVSELKTTLRSSLLEVAYSENKRKIRKVIPASDIEKFIPKQDILKKQGIYLISGGLGGLGMIFSKYLADHYQAHLILIGRSKLNATIQRSLKTLETTASSVHYLSADITDSQSLKKAFAELPPAFQNLSGVIHGAGLKKDSFILKKNKDEFNQVIETKVKGALNLDVLTKNMKLDFMLLFSSIASLIPNQGQSDYAAANSFLDRFSKIRNQLVREGKRFGLSLAINWPLWASGGMQVTPEQEEHLKAVFGMDPLETDLGVKAFLHLLNYAHESKENPDQVILISGDKTKIMAAFGGDEIQIPISTKPTQEESEAGALEILKSTISSVLKIPASDLDLDTDFEQFGVNSIVITEINTLLEKHFKNFPKTLFFEHPNLRELMKNIARYYSGAPAKIEKNEIKSAEMGFISETSDFPLVDRIERGADFSRSFKTFSLNQAYVKGFSHRGKSAVPGACFLEMARQAVADLYPNFSTKSIFNNYWPVPLEIEGESIITQIKLMPISDGINFEISSGGSEGVPEIIHATGSLAQKHYCPVPDKINFPLKIRDAKSKLNSEEFYNTIHQNSDLRLSGLFRPVQELYVLDNEAVARLVFPDPEQFEKKAFLIQPTIFTGLEQTLLVFTALTHAEFYPQGMRLMPVSIESVDVYAPFPSRAFLHISAKKSPSSANKIQSFDASLYDDSGNLIAFISGNTMRILSANVSPEENIKKASSPIRISSVNAILNHSAWVRKEKTNGPVKIRVYCFHHAGGSANNFKNWYKFMPDGVELNLIQLPGRELRVEEPLLTKVRPIIHGILHSILDEVGAPYIFFGHSMGAFLAAEITKELQLMDLPLPLHLILSGFPPLYNNPEKLREMEYFKNLPDDLFLSKVAQLTEEFPDSILQNPVATEILLKILRADFSVLTQKFVLEEKFKSPITGIHWKEDRMASRADVELWCKCTVNTCEIVSLSGTHLSLLTNPGPFIDVLVSTIEKYR